MAMSEQSIGEYRAKMRERYVRMTRRKARSKILDEFMTITGWKRKYPNKVLAIRRGQYATIDRLSMSNLISKLRYRLRDG